MMPLFVPSSATAGGPWLAVCVGVLFGRHVGDGAQRGAGLGYPLRPCQLRQTEIEDLDRPVRRHHQVRGLDVPVDDPSRVSLG